jgi:hypothetical protein
MERMHAAGFPLPPVLTCPGAGSCRANCYALQGRYQCPKIQAPRIRNLELVGYTLAQLGSLGLAELLVGDLDRLGAKDCIRIHDSGDFFSQEYLDAWLMAMAANPQVVFYAYTKSHHLDWSRTPRNFRVVRSLGSKFDHLVDLSNPHARVFADLAALIRSRYTRGSKSDQPVIDGAVRIGLVYHGTRRLVANGFVRS